MGFDALLGNSRLKDNLTAALQQGKNAHFYVISGPTGSGKRTLATLLADQLINTALLRAGMLDDPAKLADNSQALLEKLLNK